MPKDWKEISTDELLNYDHANTGEMARYDRIMRHNSTVALLNVREGLHDLKKGTMVSAEKIEKALLEAEKSNTKFQRATIVLTIVIAIATIIYTIVTWQSVQVGRDANDIQRAQMEPKLGDGAI